MCNIYTNLFAVTYDEHTIEQKKVATIDFPLEPKLEISKRMLFGGFAQSRTKKIFFKSKHFVEKYKAIPRVGLKQLFFLLDKTLEKYATPI